MAKVDSSSAEQEDKYHQYSGNRIPWYVRLIWLGFWVFAVYYAIQYLFPAIQVDLFRRP